MRDYRQCLSLSCRVSPLGKGDFYPRWGHFYPRGVIFIRARASLALLSLRENEGLLVVYNFCRSTMMGRC